jgi:IS1 family transposase
MYLCNVCEQPFSETAGTPFFGLKTPMKTVCIALNELAEGLGVRAVARIHGVEPDTVLDWLRKAGQHCEAVSAYVMQELELSQVQLDELWTFVRKKEKMLSEWEKLHTQYGDTWIWIAFDPIHKLVVAMVIGDRTEEEAVGLLSRLRARLIEACLPLFTSDALPHYASAIPSASSGQACRFSGGGSNRSARGTEGASLSRARCRRRDSTTPRYTRSGRRVGSSLSPRRPSMDAWRRFWTA